MGTKNDPDNVDCYAKALPDEPMFVLLARDPLAPILVNLWVNLRIAEIDAGTRDAADRGHALNAMGVAYDMRKWREGADGKWRTPTPPGAPTASPQTTEQVADVTRAAIAALIDATTDIEETSVAGRVVLALHHVGFLLDRLVAELQRP